MAKVQIQFKSDFELKLKRLRIKTLFVKEMNSYAKYASEGFRIDERLIDRAIESNKMETWENFIASAFSWSESKDGYKFWEEISKKFK